MRLRQPLDYDQTNDKGLTINSEKKSPLRVHSPFKIRKFRCDHFGEDTVSPSVRELENSAQLNEGEAELSFGSD